MTLAQGFRLRSKGLCRSYITSAARTNAAAPTRVIQRAAIVTNTGTKSERENEFRGMNATRQCREICD